MLPGQFSLVDVQEAFSQRHASSLDRKVWMLDLAAPVDIMKRLTVVGHTGQVLDNMATFFI